MKVNNNDCSNKSSKDIKRNNLNKKGNDSKGDKISILSPKSKPIKNLKKNINNGTKPKHNFRKSCDSKYSIRQGNKCKSILSNQTININNHINKQCQKSVSVSKKVKINNKNKENRLKKKSCNSNEHKKSLVNKSFNNYLKKENEPKKLVNSLSTSSGLTLYRGKKKQYMNYGDSENNNHKINYNVDTQSIEKNINFIEENKQNINNFCYDTISKEEEVNEKKIVLKCDNYSLLTFGNSFSYSNSQKSKSTKKYFNNEQNNNNDKIINIHNDINNKNSCFNNSYVNKLKEENETLRKELKQSNDQITFLMYQIKELKEQNYISKRNIKNKISPPNLWGKKIKIDLPDKENSNNNYNIDKNITSLNNKNEKMKNKSLIRHESVIKNGKSKPKKERIRSNKNLNINNKKTNNMHFNHNTRPSMKIYECISQIKI